MSVIADTYIQPATLKEAIQIASELDMPYKFIAGGTDVMTNRYQGNDDSPCLIDLNRVEGLKGIRIDGKYLTIGAMERLSDLQQDPEITGRFPALAEAARSVGSPLIRQTATIGGNILCENRCLFYNQSEWWRTSIGFCLKCEGDQCIATGGKKACFSELVSDTAPVLISMQAEVIWMDKQGEKRQWLKDIFTGNGVLPRAIPPTAVLTGIRIPLDRSFKTVFRKLRQRESLEFTSLTSAVTLDNRQQLTIALAGVDPGPVIVEANQTDDQEDMIRSALKGARAIDNDMFTRNYRRNMIRYYLQQSFRELLGKS